MMHLRVFKLFWGLENREYQDDQGHYIFYFANAVKITFYINNKPYNKRQIFKNRLWYLN